MSGRINLLAAVLALQLVVIAAVLFVETGFGEPDEGPFLSFDADEVDEIRITGDGEDAETLALTRADDRWRLPDGLPADANKVRDVLAKLADLHAPWPVATSSGAARRFEVTADDFQRRVVLRSGGDDVADLYLGTSPGYQQVHARRADEDAVYSVGISNYQLPAGASDWLDKALLQPKGTVSAVEREGDWRLTRTDDGWRLDDEAADGDAAEDLVRRISELRVTGVVEAGEDEEESAARFAVTDEAGTYRLVLSEEDEGNQYRVRSDRQEGVFSLAGYLAERLLIERDTLVASEAEGEPAPAEGAEAAPEDTAAPAKPGA